MDSFEIVLPRANLSQSHLGRVQGCLYVRIAGQAFPRENWEDNPLNLMKWWGDALQHYRSGKGQSLIFDFMDGPYLLEMRPHEDPECLKIALNTGDREIFTTLSEALIGLESLTLSWIEAAETLLTWCEAHGNRKKLYWAIKAHHDSLKAISYAYV